MRLLIVPVGIEIKTIQIASANKKNLLIVPVGIEMLLFYQPWEQMPLLIVPVGIEMILNGICGYELEAF